MHIPLCIFSAKIMDHYKLHDLVHNGHVQRHGWLATDSDASYLSAPKAHSHSVGYHYLSSRHVSSATSTSTPPQHNGLSDVLCQIMH